MNQSILKYISTRLVTRKSKSAFQEGARKAMRDIGYVIIAHEGWVVKKYADGSIEQLEELDNNSESQQLILD